jgi:hypothetical protein
MNVRHKHLAHSLTKTKLEKKRVARAGLKNLNETISGVSA